MTNFLLIISAILLIVQATAQGSIIGADDRVAVDLSLAASRATGLLIHPAGKGVCTAELISDALILTASHCVIPESREYLFMPAYDGKAGKSARVSRVVSRGEQEPLLGMLGGATANRRNDWAVMELDQPLGKSFGKWTLSTIDELKLRYRGLTIHAQGYMPGEKLITPAIHKSCNAWQVASGLLSTDCDWQPGFSGGAAWVEVSGRPVLIGLTNASNTTAADGSCGSYHAKRCASIVTMNDNMIRYIRQIIADVEAGRPVSVPELVEIQGKTNRP